MTPALPGLETERSEFEAVMRSNIFNRAPNLASFFRYTCESYFAGQADSVKEYNIAVEALGRPADFNQKKDSIVRVEAHRLRKRLSDYYAAEGSSHSVHIEIPAGQYVPKFIAKNAQEASAQVPLSVEQYDEPSLPDSNRPAASETPIPRSSYSIWVVVGLLLLIGIGLAFELSRPAHSSVPQLPAAAVAPPDNKPFQGDLRILAGFAGAPVHDRHGRTWLPDRYFSGGTAVHVPASRIVEGLGEPSLFRSYREGRFDYHLPAAPGTYELRLHFVETQYGPGNAENTPVNSRMFSILANGQPLLSQFDPLDEAGASNRLHIRVFRDIRPDADGKLHLSFRPAGVGAPFLNALELLPTIPGQIRPIRIVAQDHNVIDADDKIWQSDQFAIGGTQVDRDFPAGPQSMLFQGERYGNFVYHIPLAPGKYTLRIYFAETFFETELPFSRNNDAAPRIFNVFANGIALLRDLNVTKEAGGSLKPYIREFSNLEPNAQGMLVLEFVPIHNYAEVNAIELLPENGPH